MTFISDVIYGLKHEYGKVMTLCRDTSTLNVDTGEKSITTEQLRIERAIPLPVNLRVQFLKSIGLAKIGGLEQDESQILVDRADIPNDKLHLMADTSYFLDSRNRRREIKRIEDYEESFVATVKDHT